MQESQWLQWDGHKGQWNCWRGTWYINFTRFCQVELMTHLKFKITECLTKEWTSSIYGFFAPCPLITEVDDCCCHEFICGAPHCKGKGEKVRVMHRYLNTGDRKLTSNLHKHARVCWGADVVWDAVNAKVELSISDIHKGLEGVKKLTDGSPTGTFERQGKGFDKSWVRNKFVYCAY